MRTWRPEGWKNPVGDDPYDDWGNGFEAGADDLLEGLLNKLKSLDPQTNLQTVIKMLESRNSNQF